MTNIGQKQTAKCMVNNMIIHENTHQEIARPYTRVSN